MQLVWRFFSRVSQSFFLFGPRGTGKSTLMRQLFADAQWIDLLNPETLRSYSARPERLFEVVRAAQQKIIVIDEVQKVPALLSVAHALIEEDKQLQFVLTGSSARKLKQASGDLLAGRAFLRFLHPFMAAELGEQFSLDLALRVGMLPVLLASQQPQEALQAYVGMYLKEEIQAEGLVRNLESFSRFLEVVSFSHTSLLNVANISRECEVKRKTVENYIQILEDLLLAFTLPVFAKRAQRALAAHSKLYLFDAGVFRALRPAGVLDRPEEIEGAALEGLVAQHLRAWNDYSSIKCDLGYWRTRSGVEVDFVVYGEPGFWALEVKNAKRVSTADTRSLESFMEDYPMAKPMLLYRGHERLLINNILCIPVEEFLRGLRPDQPLIPH